MTYTSSGFTQSATLLGSVQGVVVHARKYASSPTTLNLTIADFSFTVLYPCETSAVERGVPQRGQYGTILNPLYRRPLFQISERAHHSDSMKSSSYVTYGLSMSAQKPTVPEKSSHIPLYFQTDSLHCLINGSIPYSSICSFPFNPRSFSTSSSTGRPCVSHPALRGTYLPFIVWNLGIISFIVRVST